MRTLKNAKHPIFYEEVVTYAFNRTVKHFWETRPELHGLCRSFTITSIRANKLYGSKSERIGRIDAFLSKSCDRPPKDIVFDDLAWCVMLDHVSITRERLMKLYFIDDSQYMLTIPHYSPIKKNKTLI